MCLILETGEYFIPYVTGSGSYMDVTWKNFVVMEYVII